MSYTGNKGMRGSEKEPLSTEERKQRLIDKLENPQKYKNETIILAPKRKKFKKNKKHGGKITYKMTGGQVVDAGYE